MMMVIGSSFSILRSNAMVSSSPPLFDHVGMDRSIRLTECLGDSLE
ncbi:hypothetical protein HNR23_001017 [Nocardiopsis mwathae]|uniref:Uncharacterized protein n=1 Tax=Nocardiopsis mwathae TaxID=1472723 RepID=A0A7X0D463_9ACTN|nr:hypothetical protein [Nocardiopsis mwathae]